MQTIKNISTGARGAYAKGVLVMAEPGQVIQADDFVEEWFEPIKSQLDHDGDGKPGGVADPSPLTADEEAELIDAMTDDELRDFIERKTGTKPHHKTGRDKLVERAKEAAGQ